MVSQTPTIRPILETTDEVATAPAAPTLVALPPDHHPGPVAFPVAVEPETPQRGIRYERGSLIYATDGPVGTLRQIVVDEDMAEVKALVVRMTAKNESVLVPPDLVDKSIGTALLLNVTKEQFALGASRSPRMDARMFTGASIKTIANIIPLAFGGDRQRSVVSLSGTQVETGDSLEAPPVAPPAPARSWRQLLRRRLKHADLTGGAGWRATSGARQG